MIASALRAFALATVAWLAGLALAVTVGFALGLSLPGPAGIVGGGLVLGAVVGLAQKRVMQLERSRFVIVSAVATPPAFLASAFLGAHLHIAGLTALAGPLVVVAQAALGGFGGKPSHSALGAVGWAIAIGALVVPGVPVGMRALALFVPGMMAAAYVTITRRSLARAHGTFPFGFHFASAQQRKPVE